MSSNITDYTCTIESLTVSSKRGLSGKYSIVLKAVILHVFWFMVTWTSLWLHEPGWGFKIGLCMVYIRLQIRFILPEFTPHVYHTTTSLDQPLLLCHFKNMITCCLFVSLNFPSALTVVLGGVQSRTLVAMNWQCTLLFWRCTTLLILAVSSNENLKDLL